MILLLTSDDTFNDLHELADSHAKAIKINREELARLLVDYTAMYNALRAKGLVQVPTPARTRARLK